ALVSDRAYRPTTSDTSTSIFKKSSKKDKMLKSLCYFNRSGKSGPDRFQQPRILRFGSEDASLSLHP
ncbi:MULTISPECIES: hypothetical protein, partial [unclassified Sinorhizobium]|uniref:hypothetical protein n=1 Tax=unclassified Sinorhizobium TaxID=2613772 RepID=UPI0024C43024